MQRRIGCFVCPTWSFTVRMLSIWLTYFLLPGLDMVHFCQSNPSLNPVNCILARASSQARPIFPRSFNKVLGQVVLAWFCLLVCLHGLPIFVLTVGIRIHRLELITPFKITTDHRTLSSNLKETLQINATTAFIIIVPSCVVTFALVQATS